MKVKSRASLQMTCAMVISGTVGWFVLASGQPPLVVVFWRCLFGALALLLVCAGLGVLRDHRLSCWQALLISLGGLALVLNWLLLFSAYQHASIAVATVVYHTQPFMLVGLGVLFFNERFSWSKAGWLLIAFAGMACIVSAKSSTGASGAAYLYGVLLALGSAFFYAIAAAITKRLKEVPAHLIVLIQMLVGVVVMGPFARLAEVGQIQDAWVYLIAIGVIHTGLMSTLLYGAIQEIPTALVGALSFIYPVVAILVDWVAFDHPLSLLQLLGAVAILLAAAGMTCAWTLPITGRR
ncbi:DMT family transporter [Pseudomonas sp. LD120]|uniref:DMT family transporter n=1 Tax=Pseudomonas sp. LD120 TaxID=485751 RepID=UPI00135A4AFB|nr:DMT family transporter [Pseudomonas sp. LD120]KAF0865667.1 EamA family transporter [Pseudomonas sp. LD120]